MDIRNEFGHSFAKEWDRFIICQELNEKQIQQFTRYLILLREISQQINITTITSPRRIVSDHFHDSLQLRRACDLKSIASLCDVGTGGGFPGIPLKIMFPHLRLVLIEVNKKKITFLHRLIDELELSECELYTLDWRTFLRNTDYDLDLFCARASLQPEELIRMFKPSCPYNNSQLIYWASGEWEPEKRVVPFIEREEPYTVGNKERKLIFFKDHSR